MRVVGLFLNERFEVFISNGPPEFRKPYIGMWTRLEKYKNDLVKVKRDESLYVGDAAGRISSAVYNCSGLEFF